MTPKQREYLSKYLADVSKGALLAVLVGIGSGKLSALYVVVVLFGAALACYWGYLLEGRHDPTERI